MVGTLILCETNEIVPFKCKECGLRKSIDSGKSTERHFKAVHEVIKYYDCSQCLFAATSIRGLNSHVAQSHPTST